MEMISPAFAVPTLLFAAALQLMPTSAAAQSDGLTVRSFVVAQCGAELAAYEKAVPDGQSVWQSRVSTKTLDSSRESANQVGAWLGSVYPLMDAFVMAQSELRPEQRRDIASRLGRALNLADCLLPNSAQLDVYKEEGPLDAAETIKASECIVYRAKTVHEAMLSGMGATELRALAEKQAKAAWASDCEDFQ